jgi:hypothetical protein
MALIGAINCWHCGRTIEFTERIGFRDECPGCGRAVHVCRNCGFYDPAYNNSCREPMAERVIDKERFNFCEYFSAGTGGGERDRAAAGAIRGESDAESRLKGLFKKRT